MKISVVIPVYNEEGSIEAVHAEIVKALNKPGCSGEIIFVDDGSTDKTFNILSRLSPARVIKFRKNFGQTAAMDAGIKAARGDYIVTMDGDGQNDPADIPRLLAHIEQSGLDAVSGWRNKRRDTLSKRTASCAAARLRKFLIDDGIHDSGCTLKIYRRHCFERVDLAGEMHRFIPAVLMIKGFRVGEIKVNHRPRTAGATKYKWSRGIKGGLDMVSVWFWKKYSNRPLHLFGGIGLVVFGLSASAGIIAIYQKIFQGIDLSDTALTTLAFFGLFTGMQFIIFGLVADVLSKIYFAATRDVIYDIDKVIENP
jgi:glycosyltransferase involved in cell wall biosynthesis